ncbi:MAG: MFS transporter [Candidatus Rokubacteria bacterium]|nr:MFS transporter [Candidatus Rokubacteria bacterium]
MAALGADFGLFLIGLEFASQSTVLPAFAVYLGAPNVVIGAIPAVLTVGWFLPSLFVASHTAALARRLPFVMRWTIWERVPLLVLALAAFTFADALPSLALAVMLGSLLVMSTVGGLLMPAWMDVVGRAIPTAMRGRFFAVTTAVAACGGLGASFVIAWVLGAVPAPGSYGVCFLIAAACMAVSYVALAVVREPPTAPLAGRTPLGPYLRAIPALLAWDWGIPRSARLRSSRRWRPAWSPTRPAMPRSSSLRRPRASLRRRSSPAWPSLARVAHDARNRRAPGPARGFSHSRWGRAGARFPAASRAGAAIASLCQQVGKDGCVQRNPAVHREPQDLWPGHRPRTDPDAGGVFGFRVVRVWRRDVPLGHARSGPLRPDLLDPPLQPELNTPGADVAPRGRRRS